MNEQELEEIEARANEALTDSCFVHTEGFDDQAEHYRRLRAREPELARNAVALVAEVRRLRAWLILRRDGVLGDFHDSEWKAGDEWTPWPIAALRGDPAPAAALRGEQPPK